MSKINQTTAYHRLLLVLTIVFAACHTYYKASPVSTATTNGTASSIDSLQMQNRYFILRNGNEAYAIVNPRINDERNTLRCRLQSLPAAHQLHLVQGIKGKMQYSKKTAEGLGVLTEVHFFTPYDTSAREGDFALALDKVHKIEVIEHDKKKTTNSYVVGALGYTLGAAVIVGIIVAATKSSCPFVSAYYGNEFSLQGEIYGGSIYPQLARHDYLPLKMHPMQDGTLQVKISNELHERQFTDMADLWVVTHANNIKIIPDEQGNLYSIANPQLPATAWLNGNKNVLPALTIAGDHSLLYMDDSSRTDARNEVVMKFENREDARRGKLLLTLKNSYWLDLLYGEVARGFGTYYATYMREQRSKSAAELLKWVKEQQIPLEISVMSEGEWKKVTDITTIGPLAMRQIVVPVDLPVAGDRVVEIKLSAGFMFWEIDHAALDCSEDNAFDVQKLSPLSARDERGNDVLAQLQADDANYLEQPEIGNIATLVYRGVNTNAGKAQTFILHTKGYYEHIRDFKNKPDIKFLSGFRQPNALPVYGMQLYRKVTNQSLQAFAGN